MNSQYTVNAQEQDEKRYMVGSGLVGDKPFGFIDSSGTAVIPRKFERALPFSQSLAAVSIKSKWGYIDVNGNWQVSAQYDEATSFSEDFAAVRVGSTWGYIDKSGQMKIPPFAQAALRFSCGVARVELGGVQRLIDKEGRFLPGDFRNAAMYATEDLVGVESGNRWGFIDKVGNIRIPLQYGLVGAFVGGSANVWDGATWHVIDTTNRQLASGFEMLSTNYNGLMTFQRRSKWGLLNAKTGSVVVPAEFEALGIPNEGLVPAMSNLTWGYVDYKGSWIVQPQYSSAMPFRDGLAVVTDSKGNSGMIDSQNRIVIPLTFTALNEFDGPLAHAAKGWWLLPQWVYIDRAGRQVWPHSMGRRLALLIAIGIGMSLAVRTVRRLKARGSRPREGLHPQTGSKSRK